jgi:hypothetical protein
MSTIYKSNEVDNQRFYQLPKSLFNNSKYEGLTLEAKVVYSVLRDRMELSKVNGWINDKNEIYLLFSKLNLAEIIGCSESTVFRAMKQLSTFELIKQKRQGLGKPNLIFVCHVEQSIENAMNCQSDRSGTVNVTDTNMSDIHTNDTECIDTDLSDTDYKDKGSNSGEIATCSLEHFDNVNKEAVDAISTYMHDLYKQKAGRDHPRLKLKQHKVVYNNINGFMNEYDIDREAMVEMMIQFLNSNIDSDWNINHFATEGMMLNRMYEVAY